MLLFARRLAAVALIAILSVGGSGLCAGWEATPEARMACCAGDDACPMHSPAASGAGSTPAVSQAEADGCCAAAEQGDDSAPSSAAFVPVVALGFTVRATLAAVRSTGFALEAWRAFDPLPGRQVATHLLLVVFLI